MALVYHGFANNAEPAGAASGDLLVVFSYGWRAASGGAAAPSLTDGVWNNVVQSLSAAGAGLNVAIRAQWTVRGASAPSFALSGGDYVDYGNGYVCHRYSGQHATPISASGEDNDSVSGSALTLTPSVTVPSGGMAAVGAIDWNGGTPYGTPSGYTAAGDPTAEVRAFVHETSGGTTQTPTLTNGDTSDRGASVIIAIAAAAGGSLSVVSVKPTDDSTGAATEEPLTILYTEAVSDGGAGSYYLRKTSDNSLVQSFSTGQFMIAGSSVVITPSAPRLAATGYYVEADTGVVERTSDSDPSPAISGATAWNFTTQADPVPLADPRMPWAWAWRLRGSGLVKEELAPWIVNTMWGDEAGGGTVTATGIASGEAFGSAMMQPGSVSITVGGIASAEAFGAATVSAAGAEVAPSGIASSEAFGSAALQAGAVQISAAAVSSAEAFGAPQIEPGAVSVVAGAVASSETFGGATVQAGAVQLAPSGVTSGEAFGSATLAPGAISVSVSGVTPSEAFGSALVSAVGSSIVASGVASDEAFGGPTVNVGTVSVTAQAIDSTEALGGPTVTQGGVALQPSGIGSQETFGGHSLQTGAVSVSLGSVVSQEAFGAAVVSAGGSSVVVSGIASGEAAGVPAAQPGPVSASASGIASGEAFGSAALGLQVTLAGLASAEAFGTPELQQEAAQVGPLGIPSAEELGLPSVELELQYIGLTGIFSAEAFGVAVFQSIGLSFDLGRSVMIGEPRTVQRMGLPRHIIRIGKN